MMTIKQKQMNKKNINIQCFVEGRLVYGLPNINIMFTKI